MPAWSALVGCIGLSLLLGLANAASVPPDTQGWLLAQATPPGLLPTRMIAPAWAVISLPSGVAAWLAWREPGHRRPLLLWGWHLLAFGIWMQCLLTLRLPGVALGAAVGLMVLADATVLAFFRLRPLAGALLLPSVGWTCYATYISASLWWLNRG